MSFFDKITEYFEDSAEKLLEDSLQGRIRRAIMPRPVGVPVGFLLEREVQKRRENKIRQEGYDQGESDVKIEYAVKFKELELRLYNSFQSLKGSDRLFETIIAMNAVAISAANCDGPISSEDRNNIDLFIVGISGNNLPTHIKNRIDELYCSPLNIREAMKIAIKSGVNIDIYDEIIAMIIYSDGPANKKEHAFLIAWEELKYKHLTNSHSNDIATPPPQEINAKRVSRSKNKSKPVGLNNYVGANLIKNEKTAIHSIKYRYEINGVEKIWTGRGRMPSVIAKAVAKGLKFHMQ